MQKEHGWIMDYGADIHRIPGEEINLDGVNLEGVGGQWEKQTTSIDDSEIPVYSLRRAGSKTHSRTHSRAGSQTSDNGRGRISKILSRNSSHYRRDSSGGFREIVFDSNNGKSGSRAGSKASSASGRQGPMDTFARAAMKAVKQMGACWRCRFLRKSVSCSISSLLESEFANRGTQCDTENPCEACPKGLLMSHWRSVGCRRGTLETEMTVISLCPGGDDPSGYPPDVLNSSETQDKIEANKVLQESLRKREVETSNRDIPDPHDLPLGFDWFLEDINTRYPSLDPFRNELLHSFKHPNPADLIPLDSCTLDILWEIFATPSSQTILKDLGDETPASLLILLRCASLYQARLETVSLPSYPHTLTMSM